MSSSGAHGEHHQRVTNGSTGGAGPDIDGAQRSKLFDAEPAPGAGNESVSEMLDLAVVANSVDVDP